MKVMIVARGYPTDKYKMNGIFEFDQAKALVKKGIDVMYIAIDIRSIRRWRKWGFERRILEGVNIFVLNIPCGRIPKKLQDIIRIWGLEKLLKKILNEFGKPDIIHAHFITNGYAILKAIKKISIPVIVTEHYSQMNKEELDPYYERLGRFTYHRANKVISVSEHLAKNIRRHFNVDVDVVPNIIDLEDFNYNVNKIYDKKNNFSFISVGRLSPEKRMELLIKSFYEAFKDKNNIFLYIYGDGPEKTKLEKLIYRLGLNSKVFLMGLADRRVIGKKMEESDCFILASKSETFGVAFAEAMAMGLPVISTKCGGPEEFINEKNGLVSLYDDQKSLKQLMQQIYENHNKYNPQEISNFAKNKFSSSSILSQLLNIYSSQKYDIKQDSRW